MKKTQLKNSILLFLAALIWGTAFVAQAKGADHVPGFTFTAARSFTGALFLIPVAFLSEKFKKNRSVSYSKLCGTDKVMRDHMAGPLTKAELIGGSVCGTALAMASNFQQIGISHTTVAKSGFLTALYVIIVPVIGIFLKKKIHPVIWLSVAMSIAGLYLLCLFGKGNLSFSYGDTLEIICALLFAVQIISVDHYSPRCRGIILSCVQFSVCGMESLILMILFEHPDVKGLMAALPSILYVGIFSSGIAYTLQILGQKNMDPTLSSLIMCLESVISAISGWIILGQKMSPSEIAGACLMFASIVLSQILPAKIGNRK